MSALTRRQLLAGCGAALAAGAVPSGRARAAEYRLRLATALPLSHPANALAQRAASAVREDTGGRIDIAVEPVGRPGGEADLLDGLRLGGFELALISAARLARPAPLVGIGAVGFAFQDYDEVWLAMDGALGEAVRQAIGAAGLVPFARPWDGGFRQLTLGTRPVTAAADLAGRTIGIADDPMSAALFRALGARPRVAAASETYTALQLHVLDGAENPLPLIELARLWEVQSYLSLTRHVWDGMWLVASPRAWADLPADLREAVGRRMDEAAVDLRDLLARFSKTAEATLAHQGMVLNRPEPGSFRAALREAGFYAAGRRRFGAEAWARLEGTVGVLA